MYGQRALRFVHAADLHIDSPLVGLERYEGAPVDAIRGATRRALEGLVALCVAEDAKLLLLAGDLFDGAWKDFNTGLFFTSQMKRLRDADVTVAIVRGNHDAASRIEKQLRLPDNVHELGSARASTIELEHLDIAIHGQSYPTVAVQEDLASRYPSAVSGVFNVGLLHTALDGRPGHDTYAPTTVRKLVDRGYDYWALGHVHTREVVREDPLIVFPGNLQGRHVRERGAKGATVVEVEGRRVTSMRHVALDVVRFETVRIALDAGSGSRADGDAIERARAAVEAAVGSADGRLLVADVVFTGTPAAHGALEASGDRLASEMRAAVDVEGVWIARVRAHVVPDDGEERALRTDALGRLLATARACGRDANEAADALSYAADLSSKLDAALTADVLPELGDADARAEFFAEVEELLRDKLGDGHGRRSEA